MMLRHPSDALEKKNYISFWCLPSMVSEIKRKTLDFSHVEEKEIE